ncbi:MAG: DUF421 domain-containing protein [Candidatus Cyclobacteriaceae bacterium M2_1C_046]
MEELSNQIIGTQHHMEWWQISIRAFIIFLVAIFLVRISNKRIFGKHSAFDIVMGIMLGSILSRAITGNSPFFLTILAATVLVLMHRAMGVIAWKYDWFGTRVKGRHQELIREGEIQWHVMDEKNISHEDLHEALRLNGQVLDVKKVKAARLERSGDISVIPYED